MAEPKPTRCVVRENQHYQSRPNVTMQTRELKEYIERRGWHLAGDYVDAVFQVRSSKGRTG